MPNQICVADCGRGGMCQRNVWPLHHQSGGAFQLLPTPTMMKGAFALPSTPSPNLLRIGCAPSYSPDGSRAGACLPLATQLLPIACRLLHRGATFPVALCVSIGYTRAMSGKDSGFRIRVERELREKFLAACREQDRPAAQVLREFMRSFVADTDQPNERREGGRRKP